MPRPNSRADEDLLWSFYTVNGYMEEVFLQYFLFECFPAFGPTHVVPIVVIEEKHPLEPCS